MNLLNILMPPKYVKILTTIDYNDGVQPNVIIQKIKMVKLHSVKN